MSRQYYIPTNGRRRRRLDSRHGRRHRDRIPAEQYPQLFDRFFRASTATGLGIKGTGLGLAVTKAIVEAHGGTITAELGPHGGTRFTVALPT